MSNSIEIQTATRKFLEDSINQILIDFRQFFELPCPLFLTILKEVVVGEKCISIEAANDDANIIFRLAGLFDTDQEQSMPFIRMLASLISETGREVTLEGKPAYSNPVVSDIYSLSNIDLNVRETEGKRELIYSDEGQEDWKVFCSFVPSNETPTVSLSLAMTAERSLGLVLASFGKRIQTGDGAKFNPYGMVNLFPHINKQQVPEGGKESVDP